MRPCARCRHGRYTHGADVRESGCAMIGCQCAGFVAEEWLPGFSDAGGPVEVHQRLTHLDRFRDVVRRISYRDWRFRIGGDRGRYWLQVMFKAADSGEPEHVAE